jgi:lipoic acid synthetase
MIKVQEPPTKKPDWLKIKLDTGKEYSQTRDTITKSKLNTVCLEANCPNIYECWNRQTATIMILGDVCTRACGFCSIKTGKPNPLDLSEPVRVSEAVKSMGLKHVVITSVDRDDIKSDFGATIWAETINEIRKVNLYCSIEVLTPDFNNNQSALKTVFEAKPDIFSHNVECVERISKEIRPQSNWQQTKSVLKSSIEYGLVTKTGIMVGLGETDNEVLHTMAEFAELGVKIFNIGQYLQPTKQQLAVHRYVHPDVFQMYHDEGIKMGYKVVESGPLVRSSYHADDQVNLYRKNA